MQSLFLFFMAMVLASHAHDARIEPVGENEADTTVIEIAPSEIGFRGAQGSRTFSGKAYDFISTSTLDAKGTSITISRYERGPVQEFSEESAVVLLLSGRGTTKTLAIPKEYGGQVQLLNAPDPILAISAPLGGNGWKMSPHILLSLSPDHFLDKIGQIDWIIDGDLVMVDNTFEDNPWLGRAGAPHAKTYCRAKNARLSSDRQRNRRFWNSSIEGLSADIAKAPNAPPDGLPPAALSDSKTLQNILTRLLYYRLTGTLDEGRRATERDLIRCYGKQTAEAAIQDIATMMNRRLAHAAFFCALDGQRD